MNYWCAAMALAGSGVLCLPSNVGLDRLRRGIPAPAAGAPGNYPLWTFVLLVAAIGTATAMIAGPAGGVLVAGALPVGRWAWRSRREIKGRKKSAVDMVSALRALVAELRAGTRPATAAESIAGEFTGEAAILLRRLATATSFGEGERVRLGPELEDSAVASTVTRAWALGERHGLPLAELLDAVRRDAEAGIRFGEQVTARMSGPRASAGVLAVLPLAGLILGEAMGAQPGRVLLATGAGQALLLIGGLLLGAGALWSLRLTKVAVG